MPFGLCNAPLAFQRVLIYAFLNPLQKTMSIFIDNFRYQSSKNDHLISLQFCFQQCKRVGIFLSSDKIYLAIKRRILLSHVISKKKKELDLEKIEVITNLPPPNRIKDIQKILGHICWYHDLIESYSTHASLLTNL